jgi:hypothetical protein
MCSKFTRPASARCTSPNQLSNTPQVDLQRRFVWLTLRYLPHHALLSLASRWHLSWARSLLNRTAKARIIGPVDLAVFAGDDEDRYRHSTRVTKLWHGTGRYQQSGNDRVDVLDSILQTGALQVADDAYAVYAGGDVMQSVSLTPLRMIARSYADTFGRAVLEPHRYGTALMWVAYFYGPFYARMYLRGYHRRGRHYRRWHELTHDATGDNTWGKKSNHRAAKVWDVFVLGTDIEGNYPILLGLSDISHRAALPAGFDSYEVRSGRDVPLQYLTHIEVPSRYINETRALLRRHRLDVPVEPLELGEVIASRQPFSRLLGL